MDSEIEIPILDFSMSSGLTLEAGSEGSKEMSKKVREALENHGCFLLRCDEISDELREEFFRGMKSLFDLPEDTKKKFFSPTAYRGYTTKNNIFPHSETFGIDNGLNPDTSTQDFLNLMWPQGNPTFR
jgi:isopenicillin N synthase-like dioxygenase